MAAKLFKPIRSLRALQAALKAGQEVEFTGCGDGYDLPPAREPDSGGWIVSGVNRDSRFASERFPLGNSERYRARIGGAK